MLSKSSFIKKVGVAGLVKIALVATIYIVTTVSFGDLSYGPIQARPSEILNFLAFIDPMYIPGLVLGCAISNFYSFGGIVDVIVGSFATFLSTYLMYKTKNMFLASLWPVINCIFVAIQLYFFLDIPLLYGMFTVGLGEFFIMTIVGYPIFKVLFKNKSFVRAIKIDKDNTAYQEKLDFVS